MIFISDYDDCDWEEPVVKGANGDESWNYVVPDINNKAKWVWLSGDMTEILCRLYLNSKYRETD